MSSIDPETTKALATEGAARGLRWVDSPLSGGIPKAAIGQLTLMQGGAEADVQETQAILSKLAGNQTLAARELGLPPFAPGPEARARGAHEWRSSPQGQDLAFVGRSAEPQVAASLLLRVPATVGPAADGHAHEHAVEIWIQREGPVAWPEGIDGPALVRQGWRQVVTRYDAGVTRKDTAH